MVGSNQFAIISGGVADNVMMMNKYSGKNGLVFSFILKTNMHGHAICYFINAVTLINHNIARKNV